MGERGNAERMQLTPNMGVGIIIKRVVERPRDASEMHHRHVLLVVRSGRLNLGYVDLHHDDAGGLANVKGWTRSVWICVPKVACWEIVAEQVVVVEEANDLEPLRVSSFIHGRASPRSLEAR